MSNMVDCFQGGKVMNEIFAAYYKSPIGLIEIQSTESYIIGVRFVEGVHLRHNSSVPAVLQKCLNELRQYFQGELTEFSPLRIMRGTEFQQRTWRVLQKIPFGTTKTYKEIAQAIGNEKATRAVGAANGKNPFVIIVPCHRVIGSNGDLVGFGGGIWRKKWLLDHEKISLKHSP